MKATKKMALGITVAVVVLALIAGQIFRPNSYLHRWARQGRFLLLMKRDVEEEHRRAHLRRVLLLCNTDHHALLKAGREVLSQVPKDTLNPPLDGISHLGGFKLVLPEQVHIPQVVRDIEPHVCLIGDDGSLTLEMHGGSDHMRREMSHFGVQIYPVNYKEPASDFKYGDRELLPGLWYYDEGYDHNPEYDKVIDRLIEEQKVK
jgi:hypothetical protein